MTSAREPAGAVVEAGDRAAKNTFARATGEVVGKLSSLVLFAALARTVGETGLGVFVAALAFVEVATIPIYFGFDRYLLRQLAQDRSQLGGLLPNVLALKLAIAVPVVAASFAVAGALGYSPETQAAVYVLTAGLLLDSLAKTLFSVFEAFERSELLAVTLVVQRLIAAALGLAALAAGYGVVTLAMTYTVGSACGLATALVLLGRRIGMPRLSIRPRASGPLLARSLPFAASDVLNMLHSRVDVVILSLIATEAAVGATAPPTGCSSRSCSSPGPLPAPSPPCTHTSHTTPSRASARSSDAPSRLRS